MFPSPHTSHKVKGSLIGEQIPGNGSECKMTLQVYAPDFHSREDLLASGSWGTGNSQQRASSCPCRGDLSFGEPPHLSLCPSRGCSMSEERDTNTRSSQPKPAQLWQAVCSQSPQQQSASLCLLLFPALPSPPHAIVTSWWIPRTMAGHICFLTHSLRPCRNSVITWESPDTGCDSMWLVTHFPYHMGPQHKPPMSAEVHPRNGGFLQHQNKHTILLSSTCKW